MKTAEVVKLKAYGGQIIKRRVVDVAGDVLLICKEGDYRDFLETHRRPVTMGFNVKDVVKAKSDPAGQ